MFARRERESPARKRHLEKEEVSRTVEHLLRRIDHHLNHAHLRSRRHRKPPDGRVPVTAGDEATAKGKERMANRDDVPRAPTAPHDSPPIGSCESRTQALSQGVCHASEMEHCVWEMNKLWEKVVVFGGKKEIQEVLLALPTIERIMRLLKRHSQNGNLHTKTLDWSIHHDNVGACVSFDNSHSVHRLRTVPRASGDRAHDRQDEARFPSVV